MIVNRSIMMINFGARNFQCKVYSNRFIHTPTFLKFANFDRLAMFPFLWLLAIISKVVAKTVLCDFKRDREYKSTNLTTDFFTPLARNLEDRSKRANSTFV